MSTTLNTCIYIRTNTVTHMFTYIRNRSCFSFHLKFPFFIWMKVICWGRFPFIKFICRIFDTIVTKDHRQGWGGGGGQGGEGGRSSRPWDKGRQTWKIFFRPIRPQFGPKITGRPPRAPSLDPPLNCQPNLKIVSRSYRFSNNTKQWKKTEPPWVGPWVAGLLWEFKSNYRVSVKRRVAAGAEVGVYFFI